MNKLIRLFAFTLISILVFESALRTQDEKLQALFSEKQIPDFEEPAHTKADSIFETYKSENKGNLLCLGDSFTNGGNVRAYKSFPFRLFKTLMQNNRSLTVHNQGAVEATTTQAFNRFKKNLEETKIKPRFVAILAGASDLYVEHIKPINTKTPIQKTLYRENFIKGFKIYQLFLYLKYEIRNRLGSSKYKEIKRFVVSQDELIATHFIYENARDYYASDIDLIYKKNDPEVLTFQNFAPDDYNKNWYNRLFPKKSKPGHKYLSEVTTYLTEIYAQRMKHEHIAKLIVELMREHPIYFWEDGVLEEQKFRLVQTMQTQSSYRPMDVLKILEQIEEAYPQLKNNEGFVVYKNLFSNWEKYNNDLMKKREKEWESIIKIAKSEGINLILQTYPTNYTAINDELRNISARHSLLLADHHSVFGNSISRTSREKYLVDDDQATDEGYKLMADEIFRTIKAND